MSARDFYPIVNIAVLAQSVAMNNDRFVELLNQRIASDEALTPAGLAQKAGIDNSTIRKLLSGENQSPKVATAQKICKALGTTLEAFMAEIDDPLQAEIFDLYILLEPKERRMLLAAARGLAEPHQAEDPQ